MPTQPHPQPSRSIPPRCGEDYRLGVINGVLFALGKSLSSAGLVLALLVRQLGGSLALVGLLPSLQSGGFCCRSCWSAAGCKPGPYKLPLYRRAALARIVAFMTVIQRDLRR